MVRMRAQLNCVSQMWRCYEEPKYHAIVMEYPMLRLRLRLRLRIWLIMDEYPTHNTHPTMQVSEPIRSIPVVREFLRLGTSAYA